MQIIEARVSTGNPGERSGEISVWMLLLGNVFLAERSVVERSAVCLALNIYSL